MYVLDHVEFEFDLHNAVTDSGKPNKDSSFQPSKIKRSDSTDSESQCFPPTISSAAAPRDSSNLSDSGEDSFSTLAIPQNRKCDRVKVKGKVPPNATMKEKLKTERYLSLVARNQRERVRPGRARDSSPTGFGENAGTVTIPVSVFHSLNI